MSAFDVVMSQYLSAYGLPVLSILVLIFLILHNFSSMRNRWLSRIMFNLDITYERVLSEHKRKLFLPLHDIISADWRLRNEGLIRILEIGFRTGENVKYYPKNAHVIIVDRNIYIQSYLDSNPELTCNVTIEQVLISSGQNLQEVRDGSVDAVVGMFVLCSVSRPDQLLAEIKRILAPTGRYLFLEHVPEPRGTSLHRVQNVLTNTQLWPAFSGGCHLNRNSEKHIKFAQFRDVDYQHIIVNSVHNSIFSKQVRTHIIGTAMK